MILDILDLLLLYSFTFIASEAIHFYYLKVLLYLAYNKFMFGSRRTTSFAFASSDVLFIENIAVV